MMKVAIIVKSLDKKGPVRVAVELNNYLLSKSFQVKVFYFKSSGSGFLLQNSQSIVSITSLVDLLRSDVIHSHGFFSDLLNSFLSLFKYRNRIHLSTMHNIMIDDLVDLYGNFWGQIYTFIWKRTLFRFNLLYVLNLEMKNYYSKFNSNIFILRNGFTYTKNQEMTEECLNVKSRIEEIKKEYKLSSVLGISASLINRKSIDTAIRALPYLENSLLVLVGEGELKDSLIALSKEIGVSERVYFVGHINEPYTLYTTFDVYLVTSLSEGLPVSLIEAASLGIPVVASSIKSLKDNFSDDEIVFFHTKDNLDLARAVKEAISHKFRYSQSIRYKYQKSLTREVMGDLYLDSLKKIHD